MDKRPSKTLAAILASALAATALSSAPAHADAKSPGPATATTSADPRYKALAQAASTGQAVTVASMTTSDSETQALPDGSLATTTTMLPTRMRSSAGSWEDIDPTLKL